MRDFSSHKFNQDAERRTAEWALKLKQRGVNLLLKIGPVEGGDSDIVENIEQLPKDTGFVVRRLAFFSDVFAEDELRANLAGLSGPMALEFSDGGKLTNATVTAMGKIPQLQSISIAKAPQVTDTCLADINRHPALHTLDLRDTGITSSGLAKAIPEFFALKSVLLDESLTTEEVLGALKGISTIENLYLIRGFGDTPPRDPSKLTKASLASLAHLKNLHVLDLSGHPVADDWLVPLYALPLRRVFLNETNVTPGGLRLLQEKLPNCQITPTPPPKD
jgi:hypothetical protein